VIRVIFKYLIKTRDFTYQHIGYETGFSLTFEDLEDYTYVRLNTFIIPLFFGIYLLLIGLIGYGIRYFFNEKSFIKSHIFLIYLVGVAVYFFCKTLIFKTEKNVNS
jgi:hypothetical protein